jgi:hypothetical protein
MITEHDSTVTKTVGFRFCEMDLISVREAGISVFMTVCGAYPLSCTILSSGGYFGSFRT